MKVRLRSIAYAGAALSLFLATAACGSSGESGSSGGSGSSSTAPAAVPTAAEVCQSPPPPQPLESETAVKIAMPVKVQNFDHALLADALGEFKAENISPSIEILQTPDIINLLAQGKVDVGAIGLNAGVLNAIASGVDIKWVSGFTQVLPTDQAGLYVRSDWVEDPKSFDMGKLRGSTIAIGVGGLATQQILDIKQALAQGGVQLDEVKVVELASSDFGSAMQSHAVDAVSASNVQQIIDQGTGVKVAGIAPITAGGYFYSGHLLNEDRPVGEAVMRAMIRTQCDHLQGNYYNDPAVLGALSTILGIDASKVESQPALTFDLKIQDGSLEQLEQAWRDQGNLLQYQGQIDRSKVIDESVYVDASGVS